VALSEAEQMAERTKAICGHCRSIYPHEQGGHLLTAELEIPDAYEAHQIEQGGNLRAELEPDLLDADGRVWRGFSVTQLLADEPGVRLSRPPDRALTTYRLSEPTEFNPPVESINDNISGRLELVGSANGLSNRLMADGVDLRKLLAVCRIVGQTWSPRGSLLPVLQPHGEASGWPPEKLDKHLADCGLRMFVRPTSRGDKNQPILGRADSVAVFHKKDGTVKRSFANLRKPEPSAGGNPMAL
jgi:hypothetical protein